MIKDRNTGFWRIFRRCLCNTSYVLFNRNGENSSKLNYKANVVLKIVPNLCHKQTLDSFFLCYLLVINVNEQTSYQED